MSAGARVDLDVSNLCKEIGRMGRQIKGFPMSVIATRLSTEINDLIVSEGNGTWDPLSENTIIRHPKRAGGKLLQDNGILANIQMSSGSDWAEAKSPAPYAGFHVTGTKWMPKRDWTGIDFSRVLEGIADDVLQEVT